MSFLHVACLSFTGTANAIEILHEQGKIDRAPAVETCIQWEMKLGLYKLTRQKDIADDWVWIADHVVSKGVHKCLVVLGVRMSKLLKKGDLTISYKDVEPLGIVPMKVSNGGFIEAEFETLLKANNGIPPLAIVADHGSDLRCGGKYFCETHPGVISIYDVTHKIAKLYEYQLQDDELWKTFIKKCADFKKQVQLTEYSDVAPPNQRSKARYHNIDVLVDWGIKKRMDYEKFSPETQEKLQWLKEYDTDLEYWRQLVGVGRIVRDFVRTQGLWFECYEELMDCLINVELCPRADRFACDLIDFVKEEGNKVPKGKCVIGSSEIVESLFGKHKSISERGPKPMGRLVLSMASRVGERPTESLIKTAFEQIKESDIDVWLKKVFT